MRSSITCSLLLLAVGCDSGGTNGINDAGSEASSGGSRPDGFSSGGTGGAADAAAGGNSPQDSGVDDASAPEGGGFTDSTVADPTDGGSDGGTGTTVPLTLPTSGVCNPSGWCWKYPLLGDNLRGIWGSGTNDIWAVGSDSGYKSVLHWDGDSWRGLSGHPRFGGSAVSGSGAEDVWIVGESMSFHFDGSAWSEHDPGTTSRLNAVFVRTKTDAWAVGQDGAIVRWNGEDWGLVPSGTSTNFRSVWAFGPDDVWVGGPTTVRHWDGTSWSEATTACNALFGAAPNDIFCDGNGTFSRYQGSWSPIASVPANSDPVGAIWGYSGADILSVRKSAVLKWNGTTLVDLGYDFGNHDEDLPIVQGIWGAQTGNFVVVGERGASAPSKAGPIWHYDEVTPTSVSPSTIPNYRRVGDPLPAAPILFVAESDAWRTGPPGAMQRYDGVSYTQYPSGTAVALNALAATASDDVWAVGAQGTVSRWNGSIWTSSTVDNTGANLSVVWANTPSDVWAAATGVAFHFTGSAWNEYDVPVVAPYLIAGSDSNDVWLVDASNVLHHWTTVWQSVVLPAPYVVGTAGSLLSLSPAEAWLIARGPNATQQVLRWDGSNWSPVTGSTLDFVVEGSAWVSKNELWVNTLHEASRWDGSKWILSSLIDGTGSDYATGIVTTPDKRVVAYGPDEMLREFRGVR